ncbi:MULTISPECIES: hypothetical protein [unclassified Streptosporangium]|uniref:hypothetical protein n=1 Tax=unclassified Streptosporangium TaxID=2632669 RepID=UPI002E2A60EC|nr:MULTISPECIES: hypothetical protein [unclassified Streptosporangium]
MRLRIARLSLACAAGIAATSFAAAPAHAYPTNCSAGAASRTATIAVCNSGTGSYRAIAFCNYPDGWFTSAYGNWVTRPSSSYSTAYCPKQSGHGGQSTVDSAAYERRD